MNNEAKEALAEGKVFMQLSATVPVVQYGNLTPTFYGIGDDPKEVTEKLEGNVVEFWNRYCEKGKELSAPSSVAPQNVVAKDLQELKAFGNEETVLFDEVAHKYYTEDGKKLTGGSTFADMFIGQFPSDFIAGKVAEKHNVEKQDVLDMWGTNSNASLALGTAVHGAIELFGKYAELSKKTKEGSTESAVHKNPILSQVVEAFFDEETLKEKALYEVFVADKESGYCGFIDRLVITGEKTCIIEDIKTNPDINKKSTIKAPFNKDVEGTKLGGYWLQLSLYAHLMSLVGWKVEKLKIKNLIDGEFVVYEHDPIDVTKGMK